MKRKILNDQIDEMTNGKLRLEQSCSVLQNMEAVHRRRLNCYYELESMGLGLNELSLLRNTIVEIATENNINSYAAVLDFFKFLEKVYDIKIGSRLQNNHQQYNNTETPDNYNKNSSASSFYESIKICNSLPQQQHKPKTPLSNIIYFSSSYLGLMNQKTLDMLDKLKEENEEFTRNNKH